MIAGGHLLNSRVSFTKADVDQPSFQETNQPLGGKLIAFGHFHSERAVIRLD